jgi:CheY-like chemotaxis protein
LARDAVDVDHSGMTSLAYAASHPGNGALAPSPRPALQLFTNDRPLETIERGASQLDGALLRLVPSRHTQMILVAAEEDVLELLSFHLGSSFEVLRAEDGEQALRLALVHEPDLVVLDVHMQKLDGYEVTRLIRQHSTTRETPVILLDTHPERIDTLRGFAVGADDYLTKLDPARLLARVTEALDR